MTRNGSHPSRVTINRSSKKVRSWSCGFWVMNDEIFTRKNQTRKAVAKLLVLYTNAIKFYIVHRAKISKCSNTFEMDHASNCAEEVFVVKMLKNSVLWGCLIANLNGNF